MTESDTPAEPAADRRGKPRPRTRMPAAERRASILAAATEVFSETGYQRSKVSDIARRVGVTEPVVFQNFGSKSALYEAVLDHAATAVTTLLAQAADAGRPVPDVLATFIDPAHMDRFHQRGAHGFLFADAAALAHDPALGEAARHVHQHFAQALADLVHRGQQAGDIRPDVTPHAAAWGLISLLAGRSFRAAVVPDPAATEAELTEMTLRSLLPRAQQRPEKP
ncbi:MULTISPECIES: TetR/AcrR family transcriptional regulator [unclassified Streptomyces]|uniref:TetR/AcrR family transcriptional regulator n=1 Tax=unclassified Streptomyces TaxID=2593676 RepID=UPI002E8123C2|nr:TetR/AcrR family transcriptional regulator [Streptomyces sp. NBC_00589]WTI35067.1 TetR/AcrR family transcriptional regulator [Streptomyces sp. NBC_00775]WUB31259.1 TetR/AcrR family transcriptional regulator [Streptomyces sp. NBC_00589]